MGQIKLILGEGIKLRAMVIPNITKNTYINFQQKKINLLEIGSFSGASAASFAKYFSNSSIFCIDIYKPKG